VQFDEQAFEKLFVDWHGSSHAYACSVLRDELACRRSGTGHLLLYLGKKREFADTGFDESPFIRERLSRMSKLVTEQRKILL
jgi:hypothetical protein